MAIITAQNLTKRFKSLTAVDNISFSVDEGELFGFLGPNGAGKTTTINILCTLLSPTGGSAEIAGFDCAKSPDEVRSSIGLIFQDTTLDTGLTAYENLKFHAYLYNLDRRLTERRIDEMLAVVELTSRKHDPIKTFSGGMKRRLEIARGLLHYPRVLFLDEPTLGLDPQTRNTIWDFIAALRRKENLTVFMTTHYMEEAENCGRIAIIDRGEIVALDSRDGLKRSVGGDLIVFSSDDDTSAAADIRARYKVEPTIQNGTVRFHVAAGETFLPEFVRTFPGHLRSVGLQRPTLDDVFLTLTGREIRDQELDAKEVMLRSGFGGRMHR